MLKNIVLVLLIIIIAGSAKSFDRQQIHDNRLDLSELKQRGEDLSKVDFSNLATALDDYQISESVAPATFDQDHADILALPDGSWLVAFSDNRLGSEKIYFQKYTASGVADGSNLLIASSNIGANLVDPQIKVDIHGHIYLVYRDQSAGLILATRYNADLTLNKSKILINDTSSTAFAGPFDFDLYPDGKMVVVWENYSVSGSAINCGLFDTSMTATTVPITVNTDGGSISHWVPSVGVDPTGDFVISWEDYRNGNADIFMRLYNGAGVALGSEQAVVPPPDNTAAQYAPDVIFVPASGYFVIGWIDLRLDQRVWIQRYDAISGFISSNWYISEVKPNYVNWNVKFTLDKDDELTAYWAEFGPENNILRQEFSASLVAVGSPIVINQADVGRRWSPIADINQDGYELIGWTEFDPENDNSDIHFALLDSTHTFVQSDILVNDDQQGAISDYPMVAPLGSWYNLIVYSDQQNDAGDIFCRTISNGNMLFNNPTRVNQDIGNNLQSEHSVASSLAMEKGLITWVDSRDINALPGQRVFGRFTNKWGSFETDEFIISDSISADVKLSPKAVFDGIGKGLVVWSDSRHGNNQLYGRRLNPDGSINGVEFIISDSLNDLYNINPYLGTDQFNRTYVIWQDNGGGESTIKIVWYNSANVESARFSWSPSITDVTLDEYSASVSLDGKIYLLWSGTDEQLYLTVLDNSGNEATASFIISDSPNALVSKPSIAVDNNNYISTTWVDRRNGKKEIYYLILDDTNSPLYFNQPMLSLTPEFMDHPHTSAYKGRAWYTWSDPKSEGLNVYASTLIYQATDIENPDPMIPARFELFQNYPNPFNPSTTISFSLKSSSQVKLAIFNILGQEVVTLIDSKLDAGEHKLEWNSKDSDNKPVASGIYLYRLETSNNSMTKKMLLLK